MNMKVLNIASTVVLTYGLALVFYYEGLAYGIVSIAILLSVGAIIATVLYPIKKEDHDEIKDWWIKHGVSEFLPHAVRLEKVLRRHPDDATIRSVVDSVTYETTVGKIRRLTRGLYIILMLPLHYEVGARFGLISWQEASRKLLSDKKEFRDAIKTYDQTCKSILQSIRSGHLRIMPS